jgi:hypothetical protein
VEFPTIRQPFDRGDFGTIGLNGKYKTRAHGLAVQHDRASAAHTMFAPHMSAREAQCVAEKVG